MSELACVLTGGPSYWLQYDGKLRPVEDHPQCGPTLMRLNNPAMPIDNQPMEFLKMMDRWVAAGKPLDGDIMIVPDN